jgi:hypothetical protein
MLREIEKEKNVKIHMTESERRKVWMERERYQEESYSLSGAESIGSLKEHSSMDNRIFILLYFP